MSALASIVCLSPQPWDVDLPTNRQQIMRRAAARGHDVLYVETGDFAGKHLWRWLRRRPGGRAARRLFRAEPVAPGIRVRNALNVLPWGHRLRLACAVNAGLTSRVVRRAVRRMSPPVVLWLYDPSCAGMIGRCGEIFAVYDCVDDHAAVAAYDPRVRSLVAAGDARAAREARLVFTTTSVLLERHRRANPATVLVRNVGDYEHFAPAADRALAAPDVASLPRPVIGFTGNLMTSKVDFALLDHLARARPAWTIALVGPVRPDAQRDVERLGTLSNVHVLGHRPYDDVPRYVAGFDVGLCPYTWTEVNRSCFPLKLFEYLAAGKPVVVSGTPDVGELRLEPDVVVADGHDAFLLAIEEALAPSAPQDVARRQRIAAANSWETRVGRLLELVSRELDEVRG